MGLRKDALDTANHAVGQQTVRVELVMEARPMRDMKWHSSANRHAILVDTPMLSSSTSSETHVKRGAEDLLLESEPGCIHLPKGFTHRACK
ncbi:unnamed protein product [Phytophthora lilii]|uniref:Unnamed protein product n=1 Tax=Phytophthora lilii TaxID=2077276 RepID=A0A9W6WER3_9STRA|nr:unnamed protein product [Phytophthora lilii]